jgi:hypothetical protein
MKKEELKYLVEIGLRTVETILSACRYKNGICAYCAAKEGKQHHKHCIVWPLVMWRAEYHKINDVSEQASDQLAV